jgi:hypothetical protein
VPLARLRVPTRMLGSCRAAESRSLADPVLMCWAVVIPPLVGGWGGGGILQLGKADSSRLKPVRNDKGDTACAVTYTESQRCATPPKHGVSRGARSARDLDPWLTRHLRAGLSLFRPWKGLACFGFLSCGRTYRRRKEDSSHASARKRACERLGMTRVKGSGWHD